MPSSKQSSGKNTVAAHATHNLVAIHWTEKMELAFRVMSAAGSRHLPVIDDRGEIVGMLSDRDLQRAMQIDQADFTSAKTPQAEFDPNARVRDYMSWPIQSIDEKKPIAEAARLMIDRKISSLIVLRDQVAVGVITSDDLLQVLVHENKKSLGSLREGIMVALSDSPISAIAQSLANAGI